LVAAALLLSPVLSTAQITIDPRDGIGPYRWIGDKVGRWNLGNFVPFDWFWDLDSFTDRQGNDTFTSPGNPGGEVSLVRVMAEQNLITDGAELVRPTGITAHPEGGYWIADYGLNQVISWDPDTGDFATVVDDPRLQGIWDLHCIMVSGNGGGFGGPPTAEAEVLCAVSSRDNDKVFLVVDGVVGNERSVPDPTGVGVLDSFSTNVVVSSNSTNTVRMYGAYRSFDEWGICNSGSWCENTFTGFDEPLGIAVPDDGFVLVASYGSDTISTLFRESGFMPSSYFIPVYDSEDGLDRPVDVAYTQTSRDPIARPPGHAFALNEDGTIIELSDGNGTEVADQSLLAPATALVFGGVENDLLVLTADVGAGTSRFSILPDEVEMTVSAAGAPTDVLIGVGRQSKLDNPFLNWMWADSSNGHELTFSARREETFALYLDRPASSVATPFGVTIDQGLVPELTHPVLSATGNPSGPGVVLSIEHSTGAEELNLYQYTGCDHSFYWGRSVSPWTRPSPDPTAGSFQVRYPDLFDCFTPFRELATDPSGTTEVVLDDVGFLPGTKYCFVSMATAPSRNAFSRPSNLDFLDSCALASAGSSNGLFCSQALPVTASSLGNIVEMPSSATGSPTWYSYTVPGEDSELHTLVAEVEGQMANGAALLAAFTTCPGGAELPIASGHEQVMLEVPGGTTVYFRLTHFARAPLMWHLSDLQTADQPVPGNVEASGGSLGVAEDGQITVCWDPVRRVGLNQVSEDYVTYQVLRGPEGEMMDTILVDSWQGHCFVDRTLAPEVAYDYRISALYPLYGRTPVVGSADASAIIRSANSAPATGQTTAVDLTGLEPTLDRPTGLYVSHPDVNNRAPLDPASPRGINSAVSAGIKVAWDEAYGPTQHRVVQTDIGTGEQTEFLLRDQNHAVDLRIEAIGNICIDLYHERTEPSGEVTQSPVAGYSEAGDTDYCIDVCEEATTLVQVPGYPDEYSGEVFPGLSWFNGFTRNYVIDFGQHRNSEWQDQPYSGPFYVASFDGVPLRATIYSGPDCNNLTYRGEGVSDTFGILRTDVETGSETDNIYVHVELLEELYPRSLTELEALDEILARIEFGIGHAPQSSSWLIPTGGTAVPNVGVDLDSACASGITVDYWVSGWEPGLESFVAILADGQIASVHDQLATRVEVRVNPLVALHTIEVALYADPFQKVYERLAYIATGESIGDVNHDCRINVLDVVIINNHILGLELIAEALLPLGDFNEDTEVDILDMVAMISHILNDLSG